jgi:hypothetical protein
MLLSSELPSSGGLGIFRNNASLSASEAEEAVEDVAGAGVGFGALSGVGFGKSGPAGLS